ncbi:MAG: hypothetical protein ACRDSJ_18245 [Rubrobacteraceae bacterium]
MAEIHRDTHYRNVLSPPVHRRRITERETTGASGSPASDAQARRRGSGRLNEPRNASPESFEEAVARIFEHLMADGKTGAAEPDRWVFTREVSGSGSVSVTASCESP